MEARRCGERPVAAAVAAAEAVAAESKGAGRVRASADVCLME